MKPTGISFLAGISKVKKRYIIHALCALCWIFSGCGRGVFYAVGTEYKSVPDPPLSLLWERKLDAAPMGRVLNADPLVLQMSTGASLYAFDPYSGDKLGKKTFDRGICGPPALVGNVVLLGSREKTTLLAWDRRLEDVRWKQAGARLRRARRHAYCLERTRPYTHGRLFYGRSFMGAGPRGLGACCARPARQ